MGYDCLNSAEVEVVPPLNNLLYYVYNQGSTVIVISNNESTLLNECSKKRPMLGLVINEVNIKVYKSPIDINTGVKISLKNMTYNDKILLYKFSKYYLSSLYQ